MNRRFASVVALCGMLMLSVVLAGCGSMGAVSSPKPDSQFIAYSSRIQEAKTLIESGEYDAAQRSLEQVQLELGSAVASGTVDAHDKQWAEIFYLDYFYRGEAARLMGNVSLALSSYASAVDWYSDRVDTTQAREVLVSTAYSAAVQYLKVGNDKMARYCLQQCADHGGYKDSEALKRESDYRFAVELMDSSFLEAQKAFNALPYGYKKVSRYLSRMKPYFAYVGAYHFVSSPASSFMDVAEFDEVLDMFVRNGHVYAKWKYDEYRVGLTGSSVRFDRSESDPNLYEELVVKGKRLRTYLEEKSEHYGPASLQETWARGASETGVVVIAHGGTSGSTGGRTAASGTSGGSSGDWKTNSMSAIKKLWQGRTDLTQGEYDAYTQSEAEYNATH